MLGEPRRSIADGDLNVLKARRSDVLLRGLSDVRQPLDAPDPLRETRKQRSLPSITRANLKHLVSSVHFKRLDHPRYQRRLGRDLPVRDRQRSVSVRLVDAVEGDRRRPRDLADGIEHPLVPHTRQTHRAYEILHRPQPHANKYPPSALTHRGSQHSPQLSVAVLRDSRTPPFPTRARSGR